MRTWSLDGMLAQRLAAQREATCYAGGPEGTAPNCCIIDMMSMTPPVLVHEAVIGDASTWRATSASGLSAPIVPTIG